jgi:hypothetical protein
MNMITYTFFWDNGKVEILSGLDARDALNRAGYGRGAIRVLDFFARGDVRKDYFFDVQSKTWKMKDPEKSIK